MLAPGWYDDPEDHHLLRWWDGFGWTHHVEHRLDWPGRRPPPPMARTRFADVTGDAAHRPLLDEVRFRDP
jgi:hypothetical protein